MKPISTRGASRRACQVLPSDPPLVGAQRFEDVVDVVAAELLSVRVGEHERDHRLADDPPRLEPCTSRCASRSAWAGSCVSVFDRAKRLGQRRQRLHRAAHDQRLAVGHATLEGRPAAVGLAIVNRASGE